MLEKNRYHSILISMPVSRYLSLCMRKETLSDWLTDKTLSPLTRHTSVLCCSRDSCKSLGRHCLRKLKKISLAHTQIYIYIDFHCVVRLGYGIFQIALLCSQKMRIDLSHSYFHLLIWSQRMYLCSLITLVKYISFAHDHSQIDTICT